MKSLIWAMTLLLTSSAFAENLYDIHWDNSFTPKRKLSKIERKQKSFLSCLRKVVELNRDEEIALNDVVALLKLANEGDKLSEDKARLKEAKHACDNSLAVARKKRDPKVELKDRGIIFNQGLSRKQATMVSNFFYPLYLCRSISLQAQAGIVGMLGAGVQQVKCVGTNASKRSYIGPKLILGIGVGAYLTIRKFDNKTWYHIIDNSAVGAYTAESTTVRRAIGIGGSFEEDGKDSPASEINFGLGISESAAVGGAIRFPSIGNRWDIVIDSLK